MKHNSVLYAKMSCRRGAAVLIALLIFFLALLSGTVALTMASSNAGRYTHEKEDRQEYLAVVSAAKLILNRLEHVEVEYTAAAEPTNVEQISMEYKITDGSEDLFLADTRFQNALKTYSLSTAAQFPVIDFLLSVSGAPEMGQVYVQLKISGATFYFHLYSAKGVAGEQQNYYATLKVESRFDKYGEGNFQQDPETKKYRRTRTFSTDGAQFYVDKLLVGNKEKEKEEGKG